MLAEQFEHQLSEGLGVARRHVQAQLGWNGDLCPRDRAAAVAGNGTSG